MRVADELIHARLCPITFHDVPIATAAKADRRKKSRGIDGGAARCNLRCSRVDGPWAKARAATFRETGWSYAGAQPSRAEGSARRDALIRALMRKGLRWTGA